MTLSILLFGGQLFAETTNGHRIALRRDTCHHQLLTMLAAQAEPKAIAPNGSITRASTPWKDVLAAWESTGTPGAGKIPTAKAAAAHPALAAIRTKHLKEGGGAPKPDKLAEIWSQL